MRRAALVLLPLLFLSVGCRGTEPAAPAPGVDRQISDVESTLDAIESELAGD